jgi:hypothetical protein
VLAEYTLRDAISSDFPGGLAGFFIGGIVAIVLFIILANIKSGSMKCDVCGLPVRRIPHIWTIGGKKQTLCPRCNFQMREKVSKDRFKSKFG